MTTLVLIHSPLVGATTWAAFADDLARAGQEAIVPSLPDLTQVSPPYYTSLAAAVAARVRLPESKGPVVLVGHSGAGALLPVIAEALPMPVRAAVFVDAILPHPARSWFDTAPERLRENLDGMVEGGLLPPWNEWFAPEALTRLLPDEGMRARFVSELRPLPVAYFEELAPAPAAWPSCPCSYLQLSEGYRSEADEAELRGWPTLRVQMHHLAMLTDPRAVSAHLGRLVGRLKASVGHNRRAGRGGHPPRG